MATGHDTTGQTVTVTGTVVGSDGKPRCPWGDSPSEYRDYHDREWGRPVADDRRIFEKICLEGFQAGLSWLTILRKREGFRRAFAGFDPERVAAFGPSDVGRLLQDPGIVRHRAKIEAAVTNARAAVTMREQDISLASLVWSYEPARHTAPAATSDIASSTPESKALSAELRRRGFRFVGPTTVYASMQSLGVVNDHLTGCHCRSETDAERAAFARPIS